MHGQSIALATHLQHHALARQHAQVGALVRHEEEHRLPRVAHARSPPNTVHVPVRVRKCVCECLCVCMCVCASVSMCAHVCACVCMCLFLPACVCVRMYMCMQGSEVVRHPQDVHLYSRTRRLLPPSLHQP